MAEAMLNSCKKIVMKTKDGEYFEMKEAVAMQSQMFHFMIIDGCAGDVIPLPNVSGKIMAKVVEYCNRHADSKKEFFDGEDLKKFDAEFLDVDLDVLFELIMAANFLEIQTLLDLACKNVADMIKGKSPEEIRKIFNIKNDFTKEEEEAIRKEHAWAFEK